jgi:hypothetical protein
LLRDRDVIFCSGFREDVKVMGIKEVLSAPRSPRQRDYVSHCTSSVAFVDGFFWYKYARL